MTLHVSARMQIDVGSKSVSTVPFYRVTITAVTFVWKIITTLQNPNTDFPSQLKPRGKTGAEAAK